MTKQCQVGVQFLNLKVDRARRAVVHILKYGIDVNIYTCINIYIYLYTYNKRALDGDGLGQ